MTRPRLLTSAVVAALLAFWAVNMAPLLASGGRWGIWDWDHHLTFLAVEREALLEHAALPLWNPYSTGGIVLLQHPLSSALLPDFLLVLVFGAVWGVKLLIALRFLAGLVGAYLLGLELGSTRSAALLLAFVANGSGAYVAHVTFGHAEWSVFGYAPWTLLALWRAIDRRSARYGALAALGIASFLLAGSVYVLFGFAFLGGAVVLIEALRRRRAAVLLYGLSPFLLAAALCAVKLLPMAELFSEHPRRSGAGFPLFYGEQSPSWRDLPRAVGFALLDEGDAAEFSPQELAPTALRLAPPLRGQRRARLFQFINFNAYVGLLPLALLVAAMLARDRRNLSWGVALLALLVLALSDAIARAWGVNPWAALRELPVLGTLRSGGRFLVVATLPLALLAASGLSWATRWLERRGIAHASIAAALVLAVVGVDLGARNARILERAFPFAPPSCAPVGEFETRRNHATGWGLCSALSRTGALEAHSNLKLPRAAIAVGDPRYSGEVSLLRGHGTARLRALHPNEAVIEMDVRAPDSLLLNQNFLAGWQRLDRTAEVVDENGLIATPVVPDDRVVRLRYRPGTLLPGAALSLVALVAVAMLLGWRRTRRTAQRASGLSEIDEVASTRPEVA